jgi:radical SAM superfamily enzyme YgiQ (UPF0313 family)
VRERGAILLVACYELGHQPLSVAWPAAALERSGYAPAVMDVSVEPFDAERARRARLVVISVPMHTALRLGIAVAARVREVQPAAHVCLYGLYAHLNRDHLLAHGVDSVIAGESEDAIVALADSLAGASDAPVPDMTRRKAPSSPILRRLDLPVPSRRGLPPLAKYARLEHDGRAALAGYVEASRGCLHRCRHCPIPPVYAGRFFAVDRETVLADVRQLVGAGARHVTFGDPDFLNGPTHALRLARDLHARFAGVTFDFTAKVEHLVRHERHLPELAAHGCLFIVTAAESLSERTLAVLDKGHTRADVEHVLKATRAAGITLRPTWVPFTPWTTLDDYGEMLDFIASHDLVDHVDPVQYGIRLLVPPGSLLLDHPEMRPHLGALRADEFSWEWTHPDPRMDALGTSVSALVADSAGGDAFAIFERVRALVDDVRGAGPRAPAVAPPGQRARPPRLSEAWFC